MPLVRVVERAASVDGLATPLLGADEEINSRSDNIEMVLQDERLGMGTLYVTDKYVDGTILVVVAMGGMGMGILMVTVMVCLF